MANYKGIEVKDSVRPLLSHMPLIDEYRESLQSLQAIWDNLSLLGQLSGTTAGTGETREAFAALTGELLNNLAERTLAKVEQEMQAKSQVVIDILTRNLFERTADIGFLTTDDTIRKFAAHPGDPGALQKRFGEYVQKYSVYEDVVLLDSRGTLLARLQGGDPGRAINDGWVGEALTGSAPFVEAYGPSALFPDQAASLIYAYRVCSAGGAVLGVLALCFRFEDEMTRIFSGLARPGDASVLGLVDRRGTVIASSDPWQIPLGARFELATGQVHRIRFAGRGYLAVGSDTKGYQGYGGPGWHGFALVPSEHAFELSDGAQSAPIEPALLASVIAGGRAFSPALQEIPQQAQAILRDLDRSVWNGTVRHDNASSATNPAFSKILLREISRIGTRMGEVFDRSIGNLQATVIASLLADCAFFAALAIDIMDRNLYERANDCRWWALDPVLLQLMDGADSATRRDELEKVLAYINGLYTVYENILLLDPAGRVMAVSNPAYAELVGEELDEAWVAASFRLADSQRYAVSAFAATPLYAQRHTYIYAAGLTSPRTAKVIGSIGIVFDSAPQFAAMLNDILPRDAAGQPVAGSYALFVDANSTVIASSTTAYRSGEPIALAAALLNPPSQGYSSLIVVDGQVMAVGAKRSVGYREYKGATDPYRNEVVALVFMPLGVHAPAATPLRSGGSLLRRSAASAADAPAVEIATFHLGEYWLGLPSADVVEAIELSGAVRLANTSKEIYGAQIYRDASLPLYNLHAALGLAALEPEKSHCQVVVVRGAAGKCFGVLVDALGEVVEAAPDDIAELSQVYVGVAPVLASIVRSPQTEGTPMLILLSVENMTDQLPQ